MCAGIRFVLGRPIKAMPLFGLPWWRLASASTGGASRWRVCYQRGLPRLAFREKGIADTENSEDTEVTEDMKGTCWGRTLSAAARSAGSLAGRRREKRTWLWGGRLALAQYCTGTMLHWHNITLSQYHSATISHCHHITLSQHHNVTISHCHNITPLQYHTVTISNCHNIKLSQYHTVTII